MAVKKFIYDGDTVLQVTDSAGVTQTEYTSTANGYGDLLSAFDGTSTKYYEPDGVGSTDALTDDTQAVVDRWRYRAFGTATQTVGADANPFTWVGRHGYVSNSDTGLYLMGSGTRYYDPATAQFLSPDPIGFKARDLNLHRYSANNPINKTDPSGLIEVTKLNIEKGKCGGKSYVDFDFKLKKKAGELPANEGYFVVQRIYIIYNRMKCPCDIFAISNAPLAKVTEFYEAWYVPQGTDMVESRWKLSLKPTDYTDRNTAIIKDKTCGYQVVHGEARLFILKGMDRPDESPNWKRDLAYLFTGFPDVGASSFDLYSRKDRPTWWPDATVPGEPPGYHTATWRWSCCGEGEDRAKEDCIDVSTTQSEGK